MWATSYLRRLYSNFAAHVFDIPPRFMVFLLFLILLCIPITGVIPNYYFSIFIRANILAIFAMSWDLLVGRTGQISLGHALFFGIGAYGTGLLFTSFGLPIWITIPMTLLIGSSVALLISVPCLRVKGPYLALVTMTFPLILWRMVKWSPLASIFGGENGITGLPSFFPFLRITQLRMAEYYLTLFLILLCSIILYKIANSKTGIVFLSILDNEVASKACGINVTRYKIMSFIISGVFATMAGCMQAHLMQRSASPSMLELTYSFIPIIITFLGGIGTIYGPIVGAYIYVILDRYFLTDLLPKLLRDNFQVTLPREFEAFGTWLVFALIVLILVIKWPRGVARFATDKLEDLEEARDLDERGPRIWKRYKKKKNE